MAERVAAKPALCNNFSPTRKHYETPQDLVRSDTGAALGSAARSGDSSTCPTGSFPDRGVSFWPDEKLRRCHVPSAGLDKCRRCSCDGSCCVDLTQSELVQQALDPAPRAGAPGYLQRVARSWPAIRPGTTASRAPPTTSRSIAETRQPSSQSRVHPTRALGSPSDQP